MNGNNRLADYLRLAREGHNPPMIAEILGVKVTTVYHQLKVLRRQGHHVPSFERGRKWTRHIARLQVARPTRAALERQAALRGENVNEMVDAMLSRLAQSPRLIAAVLGEPVTPKGD